MMTDLHVGQPWLGVSLGLTVVLGLVACVSGESAPGDDGGAAGSGSGSAGSAGLGGATTGGAGIGGALSGAGGTGVGGATGGVGGTTAGVGGALAGSGGVSTGGVGGTGGMSGAAGGGAVSGVGGSTSGSSGTGATGGNGGAGGSTGGTGGSGPTCVDTPPPNGDTCANAVAFAWCGEDWMNGACAQSCGMCSGGSGGTGGSTGGTGGSTGGTGGSTGGTGGTGGSGGGNVAPPPNINGGQQAWASRYWDCCKPACGWKGNVGGGNPMTSCNQQNQDLSSYDTKNACESGGSAFMCWDGHPWQVGDQLSYGFVAASGGNYRCGKCFHLQFNGSGHSGNNPGAQAINGKHMIVQVINNGGVESNQFDLLIPGGGVGVLNACSTQWGTSDLGEQYGGFHRACNNDSNCTRQKCQQVFAGKPDLLAGCDWFLGWFSGADNPNLVYEPIACPAEITQKSGLSDPG